MTNHLSRAKFPVPVSYRQVQRAWRRRGFSCVLFVDPPGREWNGFVHRVDELVTVLEGKLEIEVAGRRTIAEPGDEVLIPREAVHSVRNLHAGTTRWLYGYDERTGS